MANPAVVTLALPAAVSNGIAQAQTPNAAGALTPNGSLVTAGVANLTSTACRARRVLVSSTGADAGVSFVIVGTNEAGAPISETVTGVASGTPVQTMRDFATVTRVTNSAATVGAITVGTSSTGSSPWILTNVLAPSWALSAAVTVSGTVTYNVEHTYDDPNATTLYGGYSIEPGSFNPPQVFAKLSAQAASAETQYPSWPVMAVRLTITSGTGTATLQTIQTGIGSP